MRNKPFVRGALLIMIASVVCVAGCSDPEPAAEVAEPVAPAQERVENTPVPVDPGMIVGEWILVSLRGGRISDGVEIPTLEIAEDGAVAGFGGVNRFKTRIDSDEFHDGRFTFGPAAATMMAGPSEAMALERLLFERLEAVSSYIMRGNELKMSDDDGVSMVFARPTDS